MCADCRVWELSQVQATKRSDVAYIIQILSLESCIYVVVVYMILVIKKKITWFLFIIELHDSFNQISLPLFFCVPILCCVFPFAMITYSVGADVVVVSKAFLEDEEPSF